MIKEKVLIIGSGAIGRGFLPWILPDEKFELSFIDSNRIIIAHMKQKKYYSTYMSKDNQLYKKTVQIKNAWLPEEFSKTADTFSLIFINVGPRNCVEAARLIEGLNVPVLICENDPYCVSKIQSKVRLNNYYFAIPDVITSNTAPLNILEEDKLSVITEDGVLFYDKKIGEKALIGQACNSEELEMQWIAKLYLHNTPHCVAAYLGALANFHYLHEVMGVPALNKIVSACMAEMLQALKLHYPIPHNFLQWYATKELKRFSNNLLYDPINRVAREPIRKLKPGGRLLGAAQICLTHGFIPEYLLIGIVSALLFDSSKDEDHHLQFMRNNLSQNNFFTYILGLKKGDALEMLLNKRLHLILEKISSLFKNIKEDNYANQMG